MKKLLFMLAISLLWILAKTIWIEMKGCNSTDFLNELPSEIIKTTISTVVRCFIILCIANTVGLLELFADNYLSIFIMISLKANKKVQTNEGLDFSLNSKVSVNPLITESSAIIKKGTTFFMTLVLYHKIEDNASESLFYLFLLITRNSLLAVSALIVIIQVL